MNMLLVEDDERIVRFMKRGLEAEHWTVLHARNHQEFEQAMMHHHVDFAICDVFLGKENGLELCRHLRQRSSLIPVLVMTAKDSPSLQDDSMAAGANGYLAKPFSFDELLAKIQQLMGAAQGGIPC